jgi:hypothetical protein
LLWLPAPLSKPAIGHWNRSLFCWVVEDSNLVIDGAAYSVPYTAIGQAVDVHATAALISIFLRGQRIACQMPKKASGKPTKPISKIRSGCSRPVLWSPITRSAQGVWGCVNA